MIASSFKLEPFSTIFGFFNFFRKLLEWLVQVLETWCQAQNWSRDHTYSQADTTETINENSDHWARFTSGTDVPYHRVSIDTIFHMQSKTLVHSAELSSSLFQQRCTK